MLQIVQKMIVLLYACLPIIAALHAAAQLRRRNSRPMISLCFIFVVASILATAATSIYALSVRGHVSAGQFALAIYFTIGVLLVLNFFDSLLTRGLQKISRGNLVQLISPVIRGALFIAIGLPYLVSVAMTYRPRVIHPGDPASLLHEQFTPVEFESSDGIHLSGWWIPAARRAGARPIDRASFGTQTVVVCHGFGADKAKQLIVARWLIPAGYNVLAFDFRAHGESSGRFTSLGNNERRDVLAAVKWARNHHAEESQRIVGLGIGLGAAALIGAATDMSEDGQAIEALAVYGAYDDLSLLSEDFIHGGLFAAMNKLLPRISLPLASLHAGSNLPTFKPAALVGQIWPRPIFVIHGTRDRIVPFDNGKRLFEAASFPKQSLWLPREDLDEALNDDDAASAVLNFFNTASAVPII